MRRELILEEGQKYLDHKDISALLDNVFIGPNETIMTNSGCYSMPCAIPPCARYKPGQKIKEEE